MEKAVHTAMAFGLAAGVAVSVIGALASPQILIWMDTPPEVLDQSVAYIRVYFAGALGMVMYNCCMGIMQAVGDSKHPLEYLSLIHISIRGPEGNIEYLGWLTVGAGHSVPVDFEALVAQSHATLEAKQ